MTDSIKVCGLCKDYDTFVLDNVSFTVPQGRIVGFIGENGAGKSTTINLILNTIRKDSGTIEVLGLDHIQSEIKIKEELGVVFDECNFHEMMTPKDIGKMFQGIYKTWDEKKYRSYLSRFSLIESKRIGAFSKGMKMKLAIIVALSHNPKLLIMDEATTGLDPVVRDELLDVFLEFIEDEQNSIFFSTHITSDIEKIADYVVLIHKGKIVFEEQKDDLKFNYGIIRCGMEAFHSIDSNDYIATKKTSVSMECLIKDRDAIKQKYPDIVVDPATLEEIMLFYVKGELK